MLISNGSDKEGRESADLPKVMECRWSFRYLEKQTLFLPREGISQLIKSWYTLPPQQSTYFEGYSKSPEMLGVESTVGT